MEENNSITIRKQTSDIKEAAFNLALKSLSGQVSNYTPTELINVAEKIYVWLIKE